MHASETRVAAWAMRQNSAAILPRNLPRFCRSPPASSAAILPPFFRFSAVLPDFSRDSTWFCRIFCRRPRFCRWRLVKFTQFCRSSHSFFPPSLFFVREKRKKRGKKWRTGRSRRYAPMADAPPHTYGPAQGQREGGGRPRHRWSGKKKLENRADARAPCAPWRPLAACEEKSGRGRERHGEAREGQGRAQPAADAYARGPACVPCGARATPLVRTVARCDAFSGRFFPSLDMCWRAGARRGPPSAGARGAALPVPLPWWGSRPVWRVHSEAALDPRMPVLFLKALLVAPSLCWSSEPPLRQPAELN